MGAFDRLSRFGSTVKQRAVPVRTPISARVRGYPRFVQNCTLSRISGRQAAFRKGNRHLKPSMRRGGQTPLA